MALPRLIWAHTGSIIHLAVISVVIRVFLGLGLKANALSSKENASFLGGKVTKSKVTSH